MGDPQPIPHLNTQMSATPSQSTVRPHTNTHGYVNISPDFSETSDLEQEEKDVDSDGMIKSHVKFDQIFDVNLSWDDL